MAKNNRLRRAGWQGLIVGVSLGVAAGVIAGVLAMRGGPHIAVQASSTHGVDNYAICTAQLDERIEAIYFLDFITGDLKAAVINTRTHRFNSFFSRKILEDFDVKNIKSPRFLLVSGVADLQRRAGQPQLSRSLVYVAEVNSGQVVAYAVPSLPSRRAIDTPIRAKLVVIDKVMFRTDRVRDD